MANSVVPERLEQLINCTPIREQVDIFSSELCRLLSDTLERIRELIIKHRLYDQLRHEDLQTGDELRLMDPWKSDPNDPTKCDRSRGYPVQNPYYEWRRYRVAETVETPPGFSRLVRIHAISFDAGERIRSSIALPATDLHYFTSPAGEAGVDELCDSIRIRILTDFTQRS